jgi:hypothetical protein
MVLEGTEMLVFKLCNCSSTSMSLDQGQRHTNRYEVESHGCSGNHTALFFPRNRIEGRRRELLQWCLLSYGFASIYAETSWRREVTGPVDCKNQIGNNVSCCHNKASYLHDMLYLFFSAWQASLTAVKLMIHVWCLWSGEVIRTREYLNVWFGLWDRRVILHPK